MQNARCVIFDENHGLHKRTTNKKYGNAVALATGINLGVLFGLRSAVRIKKNYWRAPHIIHEHSHTFSVGINVLDLI